MLKPQKGMQKKAKIGPSDKAGDEQKGGLVGCARKFAELPDCVMKLICMVTLLLSDADLCFTYISFVSYINNGARPGINWNRRIPPFFRVSLTPPRPRAQSPTRGTSRST